MKIVHVISGIDPHYGGPSAALLGLVEAQARVGLQVTLLATFHTSPPAESSVSALHQQGARVEVFGPAVGFLRHHAEISPRLQTVFQGAQIVHVHALWDEMQHRAAQLAQQRRIPYLFRPCGMLAPWSLAQGRLKKRIYLWLRLRRHLDRAAALHFTSRQECEQTEPLGLRTRAIVEPNGIRLSEFDVLPPSGAFRNRYPKLAQRPFVIFLSRLHPKKGLELLIPAFARSAPPQTMLVIAGPEENGYRATIEAMVAAHGLEDRVLFTGMLHGNDRIAALRDAQLFALPSYQENFGVAVVEALACGVPVVISDQVNIYREIVDAGVGTAVPTSVDPLADALKTWLGDEPRRLHAGIKARKFACDRFDWNAIAARWVDHYAQFAKTHQDN